MSDADLIRAASSRWLRENEATARAALNVYDGTGMAAIDVLLDCTDWSDFQIANMLTYLAMVEG